MSQFPVAALTYYNKMGGINQQKTFLLCFWMPEVTNQIHWAERQVLGKVVSPHPSNRARRQLSQRLSGKPRPALSEAWPAILAIVVALGVSAWSRQKATPAPKTSNLVDNEIGLFLAHV